MNLPDFSGFSGFNKLKEKVGAKDFGQFDITYYRFHLTGNEIEQLGNNGLLVKKEVLAESSTQLLMYKDRAVVVIDSKDVHFYCCDRYKEMLKHSFDFSIAASFDGNASFWSENKIPCRHCLQNLKYKGFDKNKNRRQMYNEKIVEEFNFLELFKDYLNI